MDTSIDDDLFYFETDHLALRGNKEYSEVLKTLLVLCAQRKQAIKDYKKAVELKKEALEDPEKLLDKIIKGESLQMPDMHCLPELPMIDWSKYNVTIPEDTLKSIYLNTGDTCGKKDSPKKESKHTNITKWTIEEQKRLEELLQIYPPEPVEMRRFKKIADALGNRTIQQVTSRVQKYFLKLYRAGLPIPGRIPKAAEKYKKTNLHKHQRHNHYLWKPTTFFPDLCVPVAMDDLDNLPGPSSKLPVETQSLTGSNYLVPSGYHAGSSLSQKSERELQVELLKRVKKVKTKEEIDGPNLYSHIGFKCDFCGEEPITGTRWHCCTCTTHSIDFCIDCVLTQMYSDDRHPLSHCLALYIDEKVCYPSDVEANGAVGLDENNESSLSSDTDLNNSDDEMTGNLEQQSMMNGMLNEVKKENESDDLDSYQITIV